MPLCYFEMARYEVYADGACSGNPGPGGWGVIVIFPDGHRRELSGFEPRTTNNRMELTGVLQGLSLVPGAAEATVVSDSEYVIKGACSWLDGWKRKGWKTSAKSDVLNRDLWQSIDDERQRLQLSWEWVRGHNGHLLNERADTLARKAIVSHGEPSRGATSPTRRILPPLMDRERVGFVGIGTMGTHMSKHLAQGGWPLLAYDVAPAGMAEVVAAGARQAGSLAQIASESNVVITMLPSSPDVEAVLCGPEGVLAHMKAGQNVIDMSTIDPLVSRRIAEQALGRGVGMLDAPVSGGSRGARDATLTIMVGGPAELLERYRPLLAAMGKNIIHCGGPGMGEVVKVCNNLIAGVTTAATAEAYALGVRLGADARVMYDVISKSSGSSWSHNMRPPVKGIDPDGPVDTDYAPGFAVDLMHKDLGLALSAAQALKVPLVITAAAREVYEVARAKGYGRKDMAAVKFGVEALCPETPTSG